MRAVIGRYGRPIALSLALVGAQERPSSQQFQEAISLMESRGDYPAAIRLFESIAGGSDRRLAARALFYIGLCYEKLRREDAEKAYQRLVRDFADQGELVTQARARLAALARSASSFDSTLVARRIWAGSGVDAWSALSPDGQRLTFPDWETGDLALLDLGSGQKRAVTKNVSWFTSEGFAEHSVHSPDGRQVAYVWIANDGTYELRILDVDGSNSRVIHRSQEISYLRLADWSSNGQHILASIARKNGANQIVLFSTGDGSLRTLKSFDWRYPEKMSLSPDGRYIAYDFPPQEESPDRDIFVLATDGSRDIPVVDHPANDLFPLWAPDGRRIVFASDRTGAMGLWSLDVAGGKPMAAARLVRPDMGRSWPMRFTRKGTFYYALQTQLQDVYVATLDARTGSVRGVPVQASRRLVGSNRWPEWSADGRFLAYVSQPLPGNAGRSSVVVTIQSLNTGDERELFPAMKFLLRLRWSPDGRALLVNGADHKNRGGLYAIDVQSGAVTPILHSESPGNYPRQAEWSPDGKAIFYKHVGHPIFRRDVDTRRDTEIYSDVTDFRLSPDGQWLAVTYDDAASKSSVLAIASIDGGTPRELVRVPGSGVFSLGLAWTRDSRHLLFTRIGANAEARDVWRIPTSGGAPQKLGISMDNLSEIRIHPDGQRIAFAAGQFSAEIWEMQNLFAAPGAGR